MFLDMAGIVLLCLFLRFSVLEPVAGQRSSELEKADANGRALQYGDIHGCGVVTFAGPVD